MEKRNLMKYPLMALGATFPARGTGKVAVCANHLQGRGKRDCMPLCRGIVRQCLTYNDSPLTRPSSTFSLQGRGRTTGGFTLIELLVVVLIIGILAAVAVPQYQKAVLKSRIAEAKLMFRELHRECQLYILANGELSDSAWFMDFDAPTPITDEDCANGGVCFSTKDWQYETDDGVSFYVTPLFGSLDVHLGGDVCFDESLRCSSNESLCQSLGFPDCNDGNCY